MGVEDGAHHGDVLLAINALYSPFAILLIIEGCQSWNRWFGQETIHCITQYYAHQGIF